jgi:hypothetical protein
MTRYDHLLGVDLPPIPPLPELRAQVVTLHEDYRLLGMRQLSVSFRISSRSSMGYRGLPLMESGARGCAPTSVPMSVPRSCSPSSV